MTQDFANRKRRKQPSKKKSDVPGWVWLFTGAVLGAFIMFLVYLADQPPAKAVVATQPSATSSNKAVEKALPKPRFDFYKLLEESEVVVETSAETKRQLQKPDEAIEYLLQVGSFKKSDDADNVRAQLLLLNLDARVEKVTIRSGETWHRVIVGPFNNTSTMSSARSTLVSNRFEALLLKRKAG